ncbi:MAG: hypothetical protein AAF934_12160, partial [Bacteroidota bacterium]
VWQLFSLNIFLDTLNPEIRLLIPLLLAGSVLGGLIHPKAVTVGKLPQDQNIHTIDRDKIPTVRDDEPTLEKTI